ncbi:hypothetical protein FK529_14815 [Tsukamurella asaccharolytica]|uniref:Uncharacterized protein n=1 Tax=Tsukamurella asaccharolytica TaxID=2592067 RepID=A0A5C5R825_9ACTN|nr:hypothetical protein [Tsukamurella asaccharolytica]TWS18584.1 hypothetical protein FK529_14815 [Tsukamurella asaccharolytica]
MNSIRGLLVGAVVVFVLTTAGFVWLLNPEQTLGQSAIDAAVMTAIWTALMGAWALWERRRDRSRSA